MTRMPALRPEVCPVCSQRTVTWPVRALAYLIVLVTIGSTGAFAVWVFLLLYGLL